MEFVRSYEATILFNEALTHHYASPEVSLVCRGATALFHCPRETAQLRPQGLDFGHPHDVCVVQADHDRSGKITKQDLTYYVRRHQGQLKKRVGSFFDFKSFWAGMMTFDVNNNGAIDYPEFIRWYTYGNREDGKHFKVALPVHPAIWPHT